MNADPLGVLCGNVGANQINPTGATGPLNNALLLEDTGPPAGGGSQSVRRVDPNTGADLGQAFVAASHQFDALSESFDQATGRVTSQGTPPIVTPGQNPPPVSGQAVACASAPGQTCTATGGVTGTWTKTASGTHNFTATGPLNTVPGSRPAIFLVTTTGIESFLCNPVGFAPPFTATCTGATVGDVIQGSTVTIRFILTNGALQDVTGTVTGANPASAALTVPQAIALVHRASPARRSRWARPP
jgi:hypothetical protein